MWMLTGANGYSFDSLGSRFDSLVLDGERVVAVGTLAELKLQYANRVDSVLNVDGATVLPGFVDNHLHLSGVGDHAAELDLVDVKSKQELLRCVHDYAGSLRPSQWVIGNGWDENRFVSPELPTMAELDAAAGGRPVLLTRSCHHVWLANTKAFALAGVLDSQPEISNGSFGRDGAGNLNGLAYDHAAQPLRDAVPAFTDADWRQMLGIAMRKALAVGLTEVHTDDVRYVGGFARTWKTYWTLQHREGLRLRVHELIDWNAMDECRAARHDLHKPDAFLEIGAAKLFTDGSFGGRTAYLQEPYSDKPGWHGNAMFTQAELNERVRIAHEKGFAIALHAIGDAALDQSLTAIELTPTISKRDRIVHAELVRPDLLARMAALGERLAVDVQPRFACSDFPWIAERVGLARAPYICAWKQMLNAGLHIGGGSDAPVEPINPLLGIHAAVTRRSPTAKKGGHYLAEALTPVEAIRLFTRGACYANGHEGQKGVIAPGWLADLTIVDRDIVTPHDVDDIRDAKVLYTIVGGEIAYAADNRQAGRRQ